MGPVRGLAGELIGHVIVVREISGDREAEALQTDITEEREAVRANSSSSQPCRTSCAPR